MAVQLPPMIQLVLQLITVDPIHVYVVAACGLMIYLECRPAIHTAAPAEATAVPIVLPR